MYLGLSNLGLNSLQQSNRFSPLSLFAAGEQGGWYDPSDFSTMFQDSAGTTPVTAVTQPVGKILDKSGRGNHLTQATATSRPTVQRDGGGFYYLNFDGIDDYMQSASAFDMSSTDKVLIVTGALKSASTSGQFLLELGPSSSAGTNFGTFGVDANGMWGNGDWIGVAVTGSGVAGPDGADSSAATFPINTAKVVSVAVDLTQVTLATEVIIRLNGAAQTFGATSGTGTATGNFSASQTLNIASRAVNSLRLTGRIYQMVIRGTLSSVGQRASLETFVGARMGIAL